MQLMLKNVFISEAYEYFAFKILIGFSKNLNHCFSLFLFLACAVLCNALYSVVLNILTLLNKTKDAVMPVKLEDRPIEQVKEEVIDVLIL